MSRLCSSLEQSKKGGGRKGSQCISSQFIFSAVSRGSVTLTIRNSGPDTYKPEIYGDRIVIQRKMSSDGASQYVISGKDGKPPPPSKKTWSVFNTSS